MSSFAFRSSPGFKASSHTKTLISALIILLAPIPSPTGQTGGAVISNLLPKSTSTPDTTAGVRNRASRDNLRWDFGGKPQNGWSIYVPLIQHAIGVFVDVDSPEFAKALEKWQTSHGLVGSGVIDEQTWHALIVEFQSRRIKDRKYPDSDDLVEVPVEHLYDPQRPVELRRVEKRAFDAYQEMISAAFKDASLGLKASDSSAAESGEKYLKIISAFRPKEYQDQLRRASPRATRADLAVNSPHFTGRALDLYVGGEPVSTKDSNRLIQTATPVYNWLVKHAEEFGFRPYFYEPWHWEFVR